MFQHNSCEKPKSGQLIKVSEIEMQVEKQAHDNGGGQQLDH